MNTNTKKLHTNCKVVNLYNCVGILDLKNFTVTEILNCESGSINTIINFPDTLEELNCAKNLIVNLDGLPENLIKINCSYNKLTKLDNLPWSLIWLDCSHNKITYLEMIPEGLKTLICSSNQLVKLEDLPNTLKYLDCEINQIERIDFLPNTLEFLNFSKNKIWKICNLPKKIKFLTGSHNRVEISVCLDGLKELEEVDLSSNCIPSIGTDLSECVNLNVLNIEYNCVKKIPILPENLTELYLWSNDFNEIFQSDLPEDLEMLGIEDFKINSNCELDNLLVFSNK